MIKKYKINQIQTSSKLFAFKYATSKNLYEALILDKITSKLVEDSTGIIKLTHIEKATPNRESVTVDILVFVISTQPFIRGS